jgi:hypothetical protein
MYPTCFHHKHVNTKAKSDNIKKARVVFFHRFLRGQTAYGPRLIYWMNHCCSRHVRRAVDQPGYITPKIRHESKHDLPDLGRRFQPPGNGIATPHPSGVPLGPFRRTGPDRSPRLGVILNVFITVCVRFLWTRKVTFLMFILRRKLGGFWLSTFKNNSRRSYGLNLVLNRDFREEMSSRNAHVYLKLSSSLYSVM